MVADVSVDVYLFFGFLKPDLWSWGYKKRCFLVAMYNMIAKRPNLEVATKRLLHQQVKITVNLVPCHEWKCIVTTISSGVDISEVPRCHLLQQMSSQWGLQKLLQGLVSHELTAYISVSDLFLTQQIIVILSKGCKPGNFESHNSLKLRLSFKFCWMWIFPWIKLSWHSCFMWHKPGWLNDSGKISVCGVIFLWLEMILLLIYMVLQFMWSKNFPLQGP